MALVYEDYCLNCKARTSHIKPDFGGDTRCRVCNKTMWDERDGKAKVNPPTLEERVNELEKSIAVLTARKPKKRGR